MVDKLFKLILKDVQKRRTQNPRFTDQEVNIIEKIKAETSTLNIDNISRTKAYASFYDCNKEIPWSFLASMVSRNAGWNMTDLEGRWFPYILHQSYRDLLFMTYERANWSIFLDAFPQLLLYEHSKRINKPLFYLLQGFSVSTYMEVEWELYWKSRNKERLMTSQIINEQNVIQKPIIEHPFFHEKVFSSLLYKLQDWFHFNSVFFPSREGELYGFSVHDFQKLDQRIELGKRLAYLLFNEKYYQSFYQFSQKTEHTGSRYDYEQYLSIMKRRDTPFLRTTYPIIMHHRQDTKDWLLIRKLKNKWYKPTTSISQYHLTEWYRKKQHQLHQAIKIEQWFK